MFKSLSVFVRSFPLSVILWKVKCRILKIKIPDLKKWQASFNEKNGIEIGGASAIFNSTGYFPVYPVVKGLDGVNFSSSTMWEGALKEGNHFNFDGKYGHQFILEGVKMDRISSDSYDFLLSCNNLEHLANPIAAVIEWKRIIKKNGVMLLILPRKEANFDHRRPFTTIDHLLQDYKNKTGEDDLTHLEEILKLHDLNRDSQAGSFENFKSRCENNIENRGIHHHVFNQNLLSQMAEFCQLKVLSQYTSLSDHFILLQKEGEGLSKSSEDYGFSSD